MSVAVCPAELPRPQLRTNVFQPVHRGVYRVGPLVAPRMREMAAVLACGPGAVISHWTAGALRRLCTPTRQEALVDVSLPHGDRGCRPGIRVHRVRGIAPEDVTVVDGIPVTTVARTIFDLASDASAVELRELLPSRRPSSRLIGVRC